MLLEFLSTLLLQLPEAVSVIAALIPSASTSGIWAIATSNMLLWQRISRLERDVKGLSEDLKGGRQWRQKQR